MKSAFFSLLLAIFGRRIVWRAGRALYMKARGETSGGIQHDGERSIQLEFLNACIASGEQPLIFDVGANVGDWTASLLEIARDKGIAGQVQVHCFEPVPSTYSLLSKRFEAISFGAHVTLIPKACSHQAAVMEMFVVEDGAGTNSLYPNSSPEKGRRVPVETTTVDIYCADNNVKIIHYLKCDTEGHDMEVMYGATRMLREEKIMALQFEYNHRWVFSGHFLIHVFEFVKDLPYEIGKITTQGVEIYDEWCPEIERFFDGNYLLIHKNVLSWYSTRSGAFDSSNTYVVHASSR